MDPEQRSRSSTPSKRQRATMFHFPPGAKDSAYHPPSKRPRIHLDGSSLDSEKDHRRSDQVPPAPPASISTSSITSVATELVDSRQATPIDEDVENQAPIDFSIGDVLRRARKKWHPDGSSTIASGALIQAKKKEYHKEQMKISVDFIDDVIKCLQQVSDCLGTDNHDFKISPASLRLAIEIMQHRCEDFIAGSKTTSNAVQGSMLTSTPREGTCKCAVDEDHLYD